MEWSKAAPFKTFEAVLFDLDGTLIDSEGRTEQVILALLEARELDPGDTAEPANVHGTTWESIGARIVERYPELADEPIGADLQRAFQDSLTAEPPPPVPGAKEALHEALEDFPTAIVTSGNRESLLHAITALQVFASEITMVCAEDVKRSKPEPEVFLKAAERLGVDPARCLAFEDSLAGLTAARAAGMTTIAIARGRAGDARQALEALASHVIADFTELPEGFFTLAAASGDA
jgi:mannitol-1-/sugar-/sorbitol-6-phosphatase